MESELDAIIDRIVTDIKTITSDVEGNWEKFLIELTTRDPEWKAEYVILAEYPQNIGDSYIYNINNIRIKLERCHILVVDVMPIVLPLRRSSWQKQILAAFEPFITKKLTRWQRLMPTGTKYIVGYKFLYQAIREISTYSGHYAGIPLDKINPPKKSGQKFLGDLIGDILGIDFSTCS